MTVRKHDDRPITRAQRKCYAVTIQSAELGIWGHDVSCLWSVVLTTWSKAVVNKGKRKGDSKNTYRWLKEDLATLRYRLEHLEGADYKLEYWFAPELTEGKRKYLPGGDYVIIPDTRLYHAHGFFRSFGAMEEAKFNQDIHKLWGEIHDSPIVYFEPLYYIDWDNDKYKIIKYKIKDATKNFINSEAGKLRVLKSRNWLPEGWKKACKKIWAWQNYHELPKWVNEENMMDYLSYASEPERYIYDAKGIANDMKRRWCEGEQVELEFPEVIQILEGTNLFEQELII
jgi:hypothetical protein